MKRHFIKKPVLANTEFWSTDVNTEEDIKSEIQKALDAGTTFEDVDDYLNELYNLEIIDDEQFSELINWAAPFTSNGHVYASSSGSVDTGIEIKFPGKQSFDTIEEVNAFKETIGDRYRRTYKVEYPDMTYYIVEFDEDESVTAGTSFWSTDVNTEEDIKAEIQKAVAAGIIDEDIDDYLDELYRLGIIDDEQVSELMNWGHIELDNYCSVTSSTESARVRFEVGSTYSSSGLYGGDITYKVVSRTANTVSLAESHISEDDGSEVDDGVKEYNIVMQDMYDADYKNVIGKQEAVVIWEYSGHEGYLFARDSKVGYEEEESEEDGYEYEDDFDDYDRDYAPSSTRGDYSPSAPWNAPGMSVSDFL